MLKYNRSNTAPTTAQMRKLSGLPMVKDADDKNRFIDATIFDSLQMETSEKVRIIEKLLQESEHWNITSDFDVFHIETDICKYCIYVYFNNFLVYGKTGKQVYRISHIVEAQISRFDKNYFGYIPNWKEPDAVLHIGNSEMYLSKHIQHIDFWERG